MTKTCTIRAVAIYDSLQHSACQFMRVHKNLGHTHPVIYTKSDMGKYNPPNRGMELERDYLLILSSINPER